MTVTFSRDARGKAALCVTGNGLKTQDAVASCLERPAVINPSLKEVVRLVEGTPAPEPALV